MAEHLMVTLSLDSIALEQLEAARHSSAGRAAMTLVGGHDHALRQTLIALVADAQLDEHESPGEATILVLTGRIEIVAGTASWQGSTGDLLVVPDARHTLRAIGDSALLLTAVPRGRLA